MRYRFTIPIGDATWAGHGHSVEYAASAAKPFCDVRAAYDRSKVAIGACPEQLTGYGPESAACVCLLLEADVLTGENYLDSARAVADVVVRFLNRGDPDLDVRLDEQEDLPSLVGDGIGNIGYWVMA